MPDVADDEQPAEQPEPQVAVVMTDRGELTESTPTTEQGEVRRRASGATDDSGADSFPASDPPSTWAGESPADTDRSPVHHIVDVRPLDDGEELQIPTRR